MSLEFPPFQPQAQLVQQQPKVQKESVVGRFVAQLGSSGGAKESKFLPSQKPLSRARAASMQETGKTVKKSIPANLEGVLKRMGKALAHTAKNAKEWGFNELSTMFSAPPGYYDHIESEKHPSKPPVRADVSGSGPVEIAIDAGKLLGKGLRAAGSAIKGQFGGNRVVVTQDRQFTISKEQLSKTAHETGMPDFLPPKDIPKQLKPLLDELKKCETSWSEPPEQFLSRQRNFDQERETALHSGLKPAVDVKGIRGQMSPQVIRDFGNVVYDGKALHAEEGNTEAFNSVFIDIGAKIMRDTIGSKLKNEQRYDATHLAITGMAQTFDADFANPITVLGAQKGVRITPDNDLPPHITVEVKNGAIHVSVTRMLKMTDETEELDAGRIGFTRRFSVDIATGKSKQEPSDWVGISPK